jgi:hypothetical protein
MIISMHQTVEPTPFSIINHKPKGGMQRGQRVHYEDHEDGLEGSANCKRDIRRRVVDW